MIGGEHGGEADVPNSDLTQKMRKHFESELLNQKSSPPNRDY